VEGEALAKEGRRGGLGLGGESILFLSVSPSRSPSLSLPLLPPLSLSLSLSPPPLSFPLSLSPVHSRAVSLIHSRSLVVAECKQK